jgi:hypothetical protein
MSIAALLPVPIGARAAGARGRGCVRGGEGAAAGAAKQSTGASPMASSTPIAAYQANKA